MMIVELTAFDTYHAGHDEPIMRWSAKAQGATGHGDTKEGAIEALKVLLLYNKKRDDRKAELAALSEQVIIGW